MASLHVTSEPRRLGWLAAGATAGVLSALVIAPAFGPAAALAQTTTATPEHTITVTGDGQVYIAPDVADMTFGVTSHRDRATAASQDAADQMTKVVAALKAAGIADKDIQTANISLQPVYDYSGNNPVLNGYEADNTVAVTLRDLTKVGPTIDSAVNAGATNVGGINFRLEDPSKVEAQAREQAMADAKTKADALASAGNVTITGIQSISEVSSPTPVPFPYAMRGAAAAGDTSAVTPVEPGNITSSVTVTVVYLIN
jgi:uncharacterized protein YggE